jgi:transcriptional regulator with PAS, ATPase and Fis domain
LNRHRHITEYHAGCVPEIKKAEKMETLANQSLAALSSQYRFDKFVGESAPMQRLYEQIGKISQTSAPTLLLGDTGTGKELMARAIHFAGSRRAMPFVPVDCSALAPTLAESELFGHVKGAFTGADHSKQGLLQGADKGTIFLDEIGELPLCMQAKFLRALQEKEIRPVGSTERMPIHARVISATNRDLEAEIQKGTFRQDLYFRLNVVQIRLPALREHKADIPLLVAYFLDKFSDRLHMVRAISEDALLRLMDYDWPGNVRELENAIECAVALSSEAILQVGDLPTKLQYAKLHTLPRNDGPMRLEEIKRRAIFRALEETGDDKLEAARQLGIGKTTLYRKLKGYSLDTTQI